MDIENQSIIQGGTAIVQGEYSMLDTGGKGASKEKSETLSSSTFQSQKLAYSDT